MEQQPSWKEQARFELGMARQAYAARCESHVDSPRLDQHLADLEVRYGHLLSQKATDAAMGSYFDADQRQPYRGRKARQQTRQMEATPAQRRYARHLLAKRGASVKGLNKLSRRDVGLIVSRLS